MNLLLKRTLVILPSSGLAEHRDPIPANLTAESDGDTKGRPYANSLGPSQVLDRPILDRTRVQGGSPEAAHRKLLRIRRRSLLESPHSAGG